MKQLVETLVKELASKKDQVQVLEERQGNTVNVKVSVDPEDMGAVIGKGGKVINAVRTIARAKATLDNVKVYVDVQDNSGNPR